MSIEINGQIFDSVEDYEKNYVVSAMDIEGLGEKPGSGFFRGKNKHKIKSQGEMINKKQMGYAIAGSLKAMFLVFGVFTFTILGFVLLLMFLW